MQDPAKLGWRLDALHGATQRSMGCKERHLFFLFLTRVTGPSRFLSLKNKNARVNIHYLDP